MLVRIPRGKATWDFCLVIGAMTILVLWLRADSDLWIRK